MRGFFKGMMSPLVGATPYNTLIFTIKEMVNAKLSQKYPLLREEHKSFAGGSVAGAIATSIMVPFDIIKVRAQLDRGSNSGKGGLVGPAKTIIANEGIAGLYKGFGVMLLCAVPGWAIYFWLYEFLKR